MNDFLDAAKNQDSEDRYEKLKKEEAGTEKNEAEKRFEQLKEEAKEEFIEKQRQREQESEGDDSDDPFITY